MNYKKLPPTIFTALFFASLFLGTANAGSTVLKVKPNKSKVALSRLGAKSLAVRKFGRNIKIISNRKLKSSGCRRIVIKTALEVKETIKICKSNTFKKKHLHAK